MGRSGVTPWSRIAIAFASHGPIQMGRYRSWLASRRMTTCCEDIMCTRTLSTTISFERLVRPAVWSTFGASPLDMVVILLALHGLAEGAGLVPARGVRRGRSVGCPLGGGGSA